MANKIWVTVKPRAKREAVEQVGDGAYVVLVRAPAREGKANQALTEILAEYFSVAKSAVRIVRGETSRKKLIEIG